MSLSFLFPLAWLGTLAAVVPLWLHLERRRAANVVRFSALQFLDDQPTAQREPLWPRDLPLLLLRLLALLLLIAAFAWPYLPEAEQPRAITRATVYVLDNTLSHQADGQFEAARADLIAALQRTGAGEQAAVIELRAEPRVVAAFTDPLDEAVRKVKAIEPSHQRGSYRDALMLAVERLQDSLGADRHIVWFGDDQENQWSELRDAPPRLRGVRLEIPPRADTARSNVAVSAGPVRRLLVRGEPQVEGLFRLHHQALDSDAQLALTVNGRRVSQQKIALAGQPQSLVLPLRWSADATSWMRAELTVKAEGDSLLSDNHVLFSLPPVREGTVAVVASSRYLRSALLPEVMAGRWAAEMLAANQPTPSAAKPDVLCIESSQLGQPAARDLLLDQLNAGRGVVLVLDRVTAAAQTVLRQLEIAVGESVQDDRGQRLRYVFYEHPLLQPLRSAEYGDLLELRIHRYHRVDMSGALPLAFSADGDPLLFVGGAHGRLIVIAFGLDRDASNWPLHTSFVPFLDRCLSEARATTRQQATFHPGESCVWSLPADSKARAVCLRHRGTILREVPVNGGQARFALPDEPGCYELTYDADPEIQAVLDVNPSPDESQLKYTDEGQQLAARWNSELPEPRAVQAIAAPQRVTRAAILRQSWWWWLIVGAMLALVGETVWLAWRRESRHAVHATH